MNRELEDIITGSDVVIIIKAACGKCGGYEFHTSGEPNRIYSCLNNGCFYPNIRSELVLKEIETCVLCNYCAKHQTHSGKNHNYNFDSCWKCEDDDNE